MQKIQEKIKFIFKTLGYFMIMLVFVMPTFFIAPFKVKGKTLGDLKKELEEYENNYNQNQNNQNLTESQIKEAQSKVASIRSNINTISNQMVDLTNEIADLEEEITLKDEEIKKILNFIQIADGESAYLEYAFGAADFTDFIYRFAVAEQLSGYNKDLIEEFTNLIEQNKKKKFELEEKKTSLQAEQVKLGEQLALLQEQLDELQDDMVSIEEAIKMQKEIIQIYLDRGCKENDDIATCGREVLPVTTNFYRPLGSGYVTSNFGERCYTLNGKYTCDFHYGIDMSNTNKTQKVYSIGTGLVAGVVYKSSCGGNKVYVQHKLSDGTTYTSSYVHLASINVSKGQVVTRDTVIGMMGGDPNVQTWDSCSTGAHLHTQIAYGLYLTDYTSYYTFQSKSINPRLLINFPSGTRNWFYDRISKY